MQDSDCCLILAAGFGTRMGEIGKHLPKVMWPFFHKSLIETQVLFARRLGYKRIYINLFHQSEFILQELKEKDTFRDVVWLKEKPEILDIGGGIHNLARQPEINYEGVLLILNADQLFWFNSEQLESWKQELTNNDALLLSLKVDSSQGYNELVTDGDILKNIRLNKDINSPCEILTYSGNALIRLNRLKPRFGPSKFFESVCSFDKKNKCLDLSPLPYWDFGTKERYFESLIRVIKEKDVGNLKEFYSFLSSSQIFEPQKANSQLSSYHSAQEYCLNFTDSFLPSSLSKGVLMEGNELPTSEKVVLKYKEIIDYLN